MMRVFFHSIFLAAALFCAAGFAAEARAETLDDASLRKIYAEMRASVHDAQKTKKLLTLRYDPRYALYSTVEKRIGGGPSQTVKNVENKQQAIEQIVSGLTATEVSNYKTEIVNIQHSDDKTKAYVNTVTSSNGLIAVPNENREYVKTPYSGDETCTDTWMVIGGALRTAMSTCSDQLAIGR